MTEKITIQSKIIPGINRLLRTSVQLILIALFLFNFACVGLMILSEMGPDFFRLNTVGQLILFASLAWTLFLTLKGRVSDSSTLAKVFLGVILVLLAVINSSFLVGTIDFLLWHEFLFTDSALYFILTLFMIGMLVSLWYFSYQKFPGKSIITIHAIVVVLFIVFFIFQYANVRNNQALVLQAYNDSFPPTEGISIYNVEYSFWSTEAYIIVPDSQYAPTPTFWERSTWGDYYDFEFVDGKWIFAGTKGYFLPSGD